MNKVIDSTGVDRGYKLCRCCVCGKISRCTPTNDYYTTEKHGKKLLCEACFRVYCHNVMKNEREE
jgi:primosomal protein N'